MKIKKVSLENILFYTGILTALYGLIRTWILRVSMPAGVCPVEDNRGIYIIAIILLVTSIIVEYYKDKIKVNKA